MLTNDDKNRLAKKCSTCYFRKNPQSKENLVIIGKFLYSGNTKLHEMWSVLENEYIGFHKIDIDNIDSKSDVKFIKNVKSFRTEKKKNDEFGVYLFGLKTNFETIQALIKHKSLLQSLIGLNRWLFCYQKINLSKSNKPGKLNSSKKDPVPICKSWQEQDLYHPNSTYLPSEEVSSQN